MKHIFVINPVSGKGKTLERIRPLIKEYCLEHELDYHIYVTDCPGDGMKFVHSMAQTGEHIRFYACGGDGTIYEVINGMFGFPNAEVAAIPLGSGNDFIRIFGEKESLIDIGVHVNGTPLELDAIKCGDKVAVNQCSMGLDAEICAKQANFKKVPALNGEAAYTASLLYCFMKKVNNRFTVSIDDGEPFTTDVMFCLCGNSRWYGGGYKGAPKAIPNDGLLDFIIVRKECGRAKMLSLVGGYKRGEHLDWEITTFLRGHKMTIHSDSLAAVNVDGECEYVNDSTFEIVPKAIKFIVPSNSTYFEDRAAEKAAEE